MRAGKQCNPPAMVAKNTKVKMAEEGAGGGEGSFNLECIMTELGSFGKYQLILLLLLSFRDSFLAMCNFNFVFVAADVRHRCQIPECEVLDSSFNASWTTFALPNHTRNGGYRLAWLDDAGAADNYTHARCAPEHFDAGRIVPCDKVVYEDYNSVVAEFDLGLEPWKGKLIGTVHNLGLVFSFIISGFVSDRSTAFLFTYYSYGRKVVIVGTPLVVGVVGLIKSFSVNLWMLLLLEFIETAFGYGNASMVLSLETVSQKRRVIYFSMIEILICIGTAFFGLLAWQVPYWRALIRAIYAPLLVTVFYIFLVDEGVRWLLAHNKRDEAVRILHKVAKYNNIELSNKAKDMITKISEETNKVDQEDNESQKDRSCSHILRALHSKKMVLRLLLVSAMFFCSTFVYNCTIVTSVSISGSKYLNFSALYLVAIAARILSAVTLTKYGRKTPICLSYLLCSLFFITSALVPESLSWSTLLFYLAGKMASAYGLFSLWMVAMEAFPTTSRNSFINLANTLGRLGAVFAPNANLLEEFMPGLTTVVFGAVGLGPALLALLLPDTSRAPLPEKLADAERIDEDTYPQTPPEKPELTEKERF